MVLVGLCVMVCSCWLVCHSVYLLACVSWCVLVGLCVMVCTCWLVCHGVYLLACVSWCVLVGLCVMVSTCWLVCHSVYLLGSVSWLVIKGSSKLFIFHRPEYSCASQKDTRVWILKGQTLTASLCDCGLFDMYTNTLSKFVEPLCVIILTPLWYIVQHPKDVMLHPMVSI